MGGKQVTGHHTRCTMGPVMQGGVGTAALLRVTCSSLSLSLSNWSASLSMAMIASSCRQFVPAPETSLPSWARWITRAELSLPSSARA